MPETMTYTGILAVEECYKCHITFAMPADFQRRCRDDGGTFWCPSAEARVTHERDQRQAAERSASAYKGRVTRLKNRAAAGICPCCTRHFENLHRHMSTKHPDFAESDGG